MMKGLLGAGAATLPVGWSEAFADSVAKDLKGTGTVVVYDGGGVWGAAQRKELFAPFEQLTGIKVIPNAQSPTSKIRASILANAPAYDVICKPGGDLAGLHNDGLLEEVDLGYFNKGQVEEIQPLPPMSYCVPAIVYSLVLGYDTGIARQAKPSSWSDLWNVEKFPGKRALYNPSDGIIAGATFEVALLADGVAPKDLYPLDLERAIASIAKLKPHILKYWTTGAESAQLLSGGSVAMTPTWNSRANDLKTKGLPVDYSWNQGIMQWDGWAVLKGTKNRENALKFIAFATRADRQARFTEATFNGPSNTKAFDLLEEKVKPVLPTNPEFTKVQIAQNYAWWNAPGADGKPNQVEAARLWQKWVTN
jgi:putative spermidine/putrescine transport system substrate-binding protein